MTKFLDFKFLITYVYLKIKNWSKFRISARIWGFVFKVQDLIFRKCIVIVGTAFLLRYFNQLHLDAELRAF